MSKVRPTIRTAFGEYEVEYVYKNALGYFAVTGKDLSQRVWMLKKEQYEELKRQLADSN